MPTRAHSNDTPVDRDEDLVRCIACRTVYPLPVRTPSPEGAAGCPRCGSVAWLALEIAPRRDSR